jgi:hypothetical protein
MAMTAVDPSAIRTITALRNINFSLVFRAGASQPSDFRLRHVFQSIHTRAIRRLPTCTT